MSFAVNQFYANGGGTAVIVRVFDEVAPSTAEFVLTDPAAKVLTCRLRVRLVGQNSLIVIADDATSAAGLINLVVRDGTDPTPLETLRNLSFDARSGAYIVTALAQRLGVSARQGHPSCADRSSLNARSPR